MIEDHAFLFAGLNILWIVGIWNAFLPGQILSPIGDLLSGNSKAPIPFEGIAPEWVTKPLYECVMCMASVHGTLWWFVFGMGSVWFWPVYVVCLSGMMKVVSILILNKDS